MKTMFLRGILIAVLVTSSTLCYGQQRYRHYNSGYSPALNYSSFGGTYAPTSLYTAPPFAYDGSNNAWYANPYQAGYYAPAPLWIAPSQNYYPPVGGYSPYSRYPR